MKKIVVIGGGTGNHTILTGLKQKSYSLTAVVTMSDDGGSSGRLRDELGTLPPGDIRQCLVALSSDEASTTLLRKLFTHRFVSSKGLNGHSFGNLFLSALTEILGDTASAIVEAGRLLSINGNVLPVTLNDCTLIAKLTNGIEIKGESNIDQRTFSPDVPIDYVYLRPSATAYPPVIKSILEADCIIIGPGDIYTSILPNLLVSDVSNAIKETKATLIYVSNLMTKPGESDGFKASDFIYLLQRYLGTTSLIDYMLINSSPIPRDIGIKYQQFNQHQVITDRDILGKYATNIIEAPLLATGQFIRHDSNALANIIDNILENTLQ